MEGWVPDALLAVNDVVMIKSEPKQEDEPAKARRLLRERLTSLKATNQELIQQLQSAEDRPGADHPESLAVQNQIVTLEREAAEIQKQLVRDEGPIVMEITPAPEPFNPGTPPRPADRVILPFPNSAQPRDWVVMHASPEGDPMFETKFVRRVNEQGALILPGITPTPFVGRPIGDIERDILIKMRANPDYRQTERVAITLPNQWTFTAIGSPEKHTRPGLYNIPRSDFRLQEALSMVRTDGTEWQWVIVIRQEPGATAP